MNSSMYRAGGSRSASKFFLPVAAIVVVVVIAVAVAFVALQRPTPFQTATSSSLSSSATSEVQPSEPVKVAVNQLFQDFNDRNVPGVMTFYDFSANVVWDGNSKGLQGAYAGSQNIQILYGATIGKTTELKAIIDNYSERVFSPTNVNVTLDLQLRGNSTNLGTFNGTIRVVQDWFYSSGLWVIVKEHWNYNKFDVEFPASSTTFPQWGVLRSGKSPDLVAEKSFEWNAGPLVAAAVYAFLLAIVTMTVLKYRSSIARSR